MLSRRLLHYSGRVTTWHRSFALVLVCAVGSLGARIPAARAQGGDTASALTLFEEGRKLAAEGHLAEACPKLQASYNLVQRAEFARAHAMALAPKLSRLVIMVEGQAPAGLEVRRDGALVDPAAFGSAVPVDPGTHTIEAHGRRRGRGSTPWTPPPRRRSRRPPNGRRLARRSRSGRAQSVSGRRGERHEAHDPPRRPAVVVSLSRPRASPARRPPTATCRGCRAAPRAP